MAQENDNNEISAKFSTLNVNAMEFVPSFCQAASESPVEEDVMGEEKAADTTAATNNTISSGSCGPSRPITPCNHLFFVFLQRVPKTIHLTVGTQSQC